MPLDGYVAGPNQSARASLGVGGEQLHEWPLSLQAFGESHGEEGGEVNASTPFRRGHPCATVMGRSMFGGGPGPRGDDPWKGYWGDDPPYHHPICDKDVSLGGGASVAQQYLAAGLLDEIVVSIVP